MSVVSRAATPPRTSTQGIPYEHTWTHPPTSARHRKSHPTRPSSENHHLPTCRYITRQNTRKTQPEPPPNAKSKPRETSPRVKISPLIAPCPSFLRCFRRVAGWRVDLPHTCRPVHLPPAYRMGRKTGGRQRRIWTRLWGEVRLLRVCVYMCMWWALPNPASRQPARRCSVGAAVGLVDGHRQWGGWVEQT
ncbi:hypothetical protein BC567DRAFT_233428 [Phyllosticta citribraziliensis]